MQIFKYDLKQLNAYILLKVNANSKNNKVYNFVWINNKPHLKISVMAPALDGKANKNIIEFLSLEWKIVKRNLSITKGHHHSIKKLLIKNIDAGYLNSFLNDYINKEV